MRVISVPGRLVRHPVTLRIIDEAGVLADPHNLIWINLIADGDVAVAEDEPTEDTPALAAPVTEQE